MKLLEREMIKFMRMCETEMKETDRIKLICFQFSIKGARGADSLLCPVFGCVSVEFISLKVIQ